MSQRNTEQTLAWLRRDREAKNLSWRGLCQKRVRVARNLPAVYPSAFAAMVATPMSERVHDLSKVTKGMVGYADDPSDSNPYGHVFTFVGRNKEGVPLVDTNDALVQGGGSVVRYNWFAPNWGDAYKFAATSCNGFDLILPEGRTQNHPEPEREPKVENFDYAIHRLEKALVWHEKNKFPAVARRIRREIRDLKEVRALTIKRRQRR